MSFSNIITQQTAVANYISRFLKNLNKLGREKLTLEVYESRLELLEAYWLKFSARHEEAMLLEEYSDSEYAENEVYGAVEEDYLQTKAYLRERIRHLSSTSSTVTTDGKSFPSVQAKLPKICLPIFSGDYLEWESFKDLFRAAVHEKQGLSDAARLQYLKGQLAGEAAKLISNIPITDANYQGAWEALILRYDNKRILLQHHLNHLLNIRSLSAETATGLKQLMDTTNETRRALDNLGRPVEHWDDWFVHLTAMKLDSNTRKDWETTVGYRPTLPTLDELNDFLRTRINALEALHSSEGPNSIRRNKFISSQKSVKFNATKLGEEIRQKGCSYCNENHYIGYCPEFKAKSPQQRREEVIRLNLCLNCLRNHGSKDCSSSSRCFSCRESHHTLLHDEPSQTKSSSKPQDPILNAHAKLKSSRYTLLATALVRVSGPRGTSSVIRALLDQGSEATFISEKLTQSLRLPRTKVNIPVVGMGTAHCGTAKSQVKISLSSPLDGYNSLIDVHALVLPNLANTFRPRALSVADWPHIKSLALSDRGSFNTSNIDLVIGADLYGYILLDGLVKGAPGTPVAQHTIFGWVISGTVDEAADSSEGSTSLVNSFHCGLDLSLADDLRRFWEIEEGTNERLLTPEEEFCERQFETTHSRTKDGRFVVRLPRRADVLLGDSFNSALRSFRLNESRRSRNQALDQAYKTFMQEYRQLNHMIPVSTEKPSDASSSFYLPHHPVWKTEGSSSKIRVVFNASAISSSGNSLNDALFPGPKLQQDLSHILLRWRKPLYVFSADIVKMFRQILVHQDDQPLQRILWRDSESQDLQTFQLVTVTYGTACAPFLAMRCLHQLADEEATRWPDVAEIIKTQMYVDDVLTGADALQDVMEIKQKLTDLLMAGGFQLAKWKSNVPEISTTSDCAHFMSENEVKTLGMLWNPITDCFGFKITLDNPSTLTKRNVLSSIFKLFDPLGWLTPVLVTARIFIQNLWMTKCDWDSPLPDELASSWRKYYNGLPHLENLEIPRWISWTCNSSFELHGFCDASQRAYAAAVYIRLTDSHTGSIKTHLLSAKCRVAPVKVVSLPRLELCGAVLLAKLLRNVQEALQSSPQKIFAWSDSQVVLAWLRQHPSQWKCFVANRTAEIHRLLPEVVWRHVPSADNSADPASRGVPPDSMLDNTLWWSGPSWLAESSLVWPQSVPDTCNSEALEESGHRLQAYLLTKSEPWSLQNRYSSLRKLLRVTSLLFRFGKNCRTNKESRVSGPITTEELARSLHYWLKIAQSEYFEKEFELLTQRKPLPKGSPLSLLLPFLDEKGLIRVGGRLKNAPLSFDERHPIILSGRGTLSKLLTIDAHERTLHGGPQLTLAHLGTRYWILRGRNLVRGVIRKCMTCFRHSARSEEQLMGQLPSHRVTPSRPFLHSGLDYAGPIMLRTTKGRGFKAYKGYIALFICLATRAIHLEAVSDLSTAAFLAAFKRFASRRGIPTVMYSDQATNFRGADAELKSMFDAASKTNQQISERLADDGTQWRFIPPRSPHFGGIWEAGVKSTKHHLRRVIGDTKLTFEELSTILAEIEACLNSRPLTPISSSPLDLSALTPGHFLIGAPLKSIPEPSLLPHSLNSLNRWQLLRHMVESFWGRWSKEYLHHLQQRHKWTTKHPNLVPGDMVLIKEELPPSKWSLGRILQVYPGEDGLVRVVKVKTANSELTRPIHKLAKLPNFVNDEAGGNVENSASMRTEPV